MDWKLYGKIGKITGNNMFSKEEDKQYNRHLILDEIGHEGQQKLKAAKVLVIGAGGLGCPILQYLSAAGIGSIGIIDHDVVDQTNLQRQVIYTHNDIGKHKAEIAAKRLSALNPYISFRTYTEKLSSQNAISIFKEYDIIVDGSDNFPTRYLANDAAVLANRPLVYGSIFKFEGQVAVFNYKNGPTYRCLFPNPPLPNEVPNCSDIGVLGVLPGIIGSLQANEVIKIICGLGDTLAGRILTFNALTLQQHIIEFKKNDAINVTKLIDYEIFCGVKEDTNEITAKLLKEKTEDFYLIDVRTEREREQFYIEGSVHIPLDEIEDRYQEIKTSKTVVVYCQSDVRSKNAIAFLKDKFSHLEFKNLKNGLMEY